MFVGVLLTLYPSTLTGDVVYSVPTFSSVAGCVGTSSCSLPSSSIYKCSTTNLPVILTGVSSVISLFFSGAVSTLILVLTLLLTFNSVPLNSG